eukprot:1018479-Ditylum_brightwellii.AAC.1
MANMSVNTHQGYDLTDIFQWELSIQMWACTATLLTNINEVGNKVRTVFMKLQSAHGKLTLNYLANDMKGSNWKRFQKGRKKSKNFSTTKQSRMIGIAMSPLLCMGLDTVMLIGHLKGAN